MMLRTQIRQKKWNYQNIWCLFSNGCQTVAHPLWGVRVTQTEAVPAPLNNEPRSVLILASVVHVVGISPRVPSPAPPDISWRVSARPNLMVTNDSDDDNCSNWFSDSLSPLLPHATSKYSDFELIPFPTLMGPENCFCEKKSCQFCLTREIKTVWSAAVLSMCARCEKKHYNSCILIVPIVPNITSDHMTCHDCHDASWPW